MALVGAKEVSIPDQREFEGKAFPLVISPSDDSVKTPADFVEWAKTNADVIEEKLKEHGAVLFRDFPVDTPEAFAEFLDAGLQITNYPYVGGAAVRTSIVGDRVFTANESPPEAPVPYHHELAQVPEPPMSLFFYCQVPPATGGQTPILLSHRVVEGLEARYPDFVKDLEEKGVYYVRVMPEEDDATSPIGRSWKSTYHVTTREEAEKKMDEAGTKYEWLPDNSVRTQTAVVPAIRVDPRSGKRAFFNSAVAAYTGWIDSRNDPTKAVWLGDGTPVNHEAMMAAADIMKEETTAFSWAEKDVLAIDNRAAMHSRAPFTRPRRILASIGASFVKGSK